MGEPVSLDQLANQINEAYIAAERTTIQGVEDFRRVGELLITAKSRCPHGQWEGWVRRNVKSCSYSEARRYMQLARHWDKLRTVRNLNLRDALRMLTEDCDDDEDADDEPVGTPGCEMPDDLAALAVTDALERLEKHLKGLHAAMAVLLEEWDEPRSVQIRMSLKREGFAIRKGADEWEPLAVLSAAVESVEEAVKEN